jgi:pilus assembly protein CpaB
MAVVIHRGMRAVAVPVSVNTAAGGFILPGDHVDVLQSHQTDASAGGHPGFVANVLMRNVRVLAIDQASQPAKNATSLVGSVATLEVADGDAEILAKAKAQGEVILALRAYSDAAGEPTRGGDDSPAPANGNVRIVRAGQASDVTVAQ